MAEFPGFGRHCSFADCHRLDFLPVRCDVCNKDYCVDHYSYDSHNCDKSKRKDVQVPVCPLCGKVVPIARGQLPDGPMNVHIETGCSSNPGQSSKGQIYKYRCSVKSCRKRELIPMKCDKCGLNFCISHRLPFDHKCTSGIPSSSSRLSSAGREEQKMAFSEALSLEQNNGTMSEDEALARALHISINGEEPSVMDEFGRVLADDHSKSQSQSRAEQNTEPPRRSLTERCKIS